MWIREATSVVNCNNPASGAAVAGVNEGPLNTVIAWANGTARKMAITNNKTR
jgi:hypothetical protein